jgi:predicted ATPase/DNA-binding CsgD family transcriptional regulator
MVRKVSRATDTLPAEVTSLVGRGSEAAEVKRLLTSSRLVTLTGPGGVGKTRLALHVARTVRGAFADGVCMVPLAELSRPDLIASAVAALLATRRSSVADVDDLVRQIGEDHLLLVLDNCEHLADAVAPVVSALLVGCPHLKVLATSRSALRIDGEAVYRVPPLALPDPDAGTFPGQARSYDGVALFLERAAALNTDVALGRVDERAVVALCQQLDGLPLAIELAAAGTRWQSVESMLARVDDPLAPPVAVSRSLPERHQSVRASLDYSHDLCSAAARTLWARLSVFRGGFTLDAAEFVCAGGALPVAEVPTALFELVDKSLVMLVGSRYTMLETIRQYGEERLAAAGEQASVGQAHLRHVADLADDVHATWFGPHQPELLGRVLADQANVRAALELSMADPATLPTGLRIASALWTFWIGSGLPGEGRHWLAGLLAASDELTPERAHALWTHAFLSTVDGDIPAARALLAECLGAAQLLGDDASAAHAISTLGVADLFEGDIQGAVEHLEAGVARERTVEHSTPYLTDALINLGLAYCYRGDLDRATAVLGEAEQLCCDHGEQLLLSWAQVFLGLAAVLDGRALEAATLARDSLAGKRALNNQQGMVWAIEVLAWAALESGDATLAALLLGAGDARAEDFGPAFHGFRGMRDWHAQHAARAARELSAGAYREAVARGRRLSMEDLVAVALDETSPPSDVPESPLRDLPLTRREREIAELVATGKTNREIAEQLVIAPRTVDTHVQNILTKLDFTSRSQVVALVAASRAAPA